MGSSTPGTLLVHCTDNSRHRSVPGFHWDFRRQELVRAAVQMGGGDRPRGGNERARLFDTGRNRYFRFGRRIATGSYNGDLLGWRDGSMTLRANMGRTALVSSSRGSVFSWRARRQTRYGSTRSIDMPADKTRTRSGAS